MAQWGCRCGARITDHKYPDKNAYRVFSDELWDEISAMTDKDGMINWYDIPLESFDAYVCPQCGRIMVFDDGPYFTSYKKED